MGFSLPTCFNVSRAAQNCMSATNKAKKIFSQKCFLQKCFLVCPGLKNCGSEAEPLDVFRKLQTTQVTGEAILVENCWKLGVADTRFFPAKRNSSAMGSWGVEGGTSEAEFYAILYKEVRFLFLIITYNYTRNVVVFWEYTSKAKLTS